MGAAPAFDARVAYNLTRRFTVEGGVNYSAPSVHVSIGSDAEGAAAATTPSEQLSQYFLDASLLVFMPKLSFARGRGRMFVEGGAGYLRQLHEGNFNVEAGQVYNAGGGVKHYFRPRPRGFVKGFGVRVDLRAYYKSGGYSFDGSEHLDRRVGRRCRCRVLTRLLLECHEDAGAEAGLEVRQRRGIRIEVTRHLAAAPGDTLCAVRAPPAASFGRTAFA